MDEVQRKTTGRSKPDGVMWEDILLIRIQHKVSRYVDCSFTIVDEL